MVNFRRWLSPQQIVRIDATQLAVARFHGLPDRFMARELMRLCRQVRAMAIAVDPQLADPSWCTYRATMLWSACPEVAARLGETVFEPGERADRYLRHEDNTTLRHSIGNYLKHSELSRIPKLFDRQDPNREAPDPVDMLDNDVANGNPLAIALDRACPPGEDATDWPASYLAEVGRSRFGRDDQTRAWSPAFQNYPASKS
jgi:hypothetical protein